MFMGLFVWLEGFKATGFSCKAVDAFKDQLQLCKFEGVMLFTIFMIIGSNAFSINYLQFVIHPVLKVAMY